MKTLKQWLELRAAKAKEAKDLIDKATAESRDFTPEEGVQFDTISRELEEIDVNVERARKIEAEAAKRAQTLPPVTPPVPAPHTGLDGNKHISERDLKELNQFSLGKLIRTKLTGERLEGLEKEVVDEGIAEAAKRGVTPEGNVVIPYGLFAMDREGRDMVMSAVEVRRDLTVTGGTSGDQGGLTVATSIGRLYEALFNKLVLRNLGATFMTNLTGNIDIPRLVKGSDPTYKTENAAADELNPTFAKVSLTPHRLPAYIEVSNQLLRQSEANISAVVQSYLINVLSSLFDKMGIAGSGSSNQPTGILNTSGIGAVYAGGAPSNATNANGAAPVWADFPNLYKEIAIDNADFGRLGYLVNPNLVAKLQVTEKATNTAVFIMPEGAKTINGFNAGVTNNVPSNLTKGSSTTCSAGIFGNFQDLWMGMWGGIELSINPYSLDTTGLTRILAALQGDCAVARPESFAACKDFLAN